MKIELGANSGLRSVDIRKKEDGLELNRIISGDMSREEQKELLEAFDNPCPERDYLIVHSCHEFTSVCPKTGQPDFAAITIEYVADQKCLELKSLKLYFFSFRNMGIYYEGVINRILDDLSAVVKPRFMRVKGDFGIRGGFSSVITAEYKERH